MSFLPGDPHDGQRGGAPDAPTDPLPPTPPAAPALPLPDPAAAERPTCTLTPAHLAQLRGMALALEVALAESRAIDPELKAQKRQRARDLIAFVERAYIAGADLRLVAAWGAFGLPCRIWVRADGSALSLVGAIGERALHPHDPETPLERIRALVNVRARDLAATAFLPVPPLPPAA